MSVTFNFGTQGKSVEISTKELHDLNNAITFALSKGSIASRTFGAIHVEKDGSNICFSQKHTSAQNPAEDTIVTDC